MTLEISLVVGSRCYVHKQVKSHLLACTTKFWDLEGGLEAEFPRTKVLSRFASVHRLFQEEIGNVLLDLLIGAQKWVHSFMREAPIASGGNELITTHLARWIEIKDGSGGVLRARAGSWLALSIHSSCGRRSSAQLDGLEGNCA